MGDGMLSREELLKWAAALGGAGLVAGLGARRARAAIDALGAESGRLQVLDWAGYEVKQLWAPYAAKYPGQAPQFTFMTNEANALAKLNAGLRPDVVRPYVGYVKDFAESGFFQPWTPSLIPNLKQLNPGMVKAGQYQGKQWGIPEDWGFDEILYRTDKVKPKARSWSLIFDERYAGKIAWFDDLNQLVVAGYYLGFKKPYDQSDTELDKAKKFLASKKHVARMFWSSETDMQAAFASGDLWIAYAWPADWAAMKAKGLKVAYMQPKEGAISWIGMLMLGKDSKRPEHAHAFANSWSSSRSAAGSRTTTRYGALEHARAAEVEGPAQGAAADEPARGAEPNSHIDRHIPRRREYARAWEEVKAS